MTDVGGVAAERLRSFIERIERMREEIKAINDDISDLYKEAKGTGFDPKVMKAVIQRRAKGEQDVSEFDELLALYERAVNGAGTESATRVHVREAAE